MKNYHSRQPVFGLKFQPGTIPNMKQAIHPWHLMVLTLSASDWICEFNIFPPLLLISLHSINYPLLICTRNEDVLFKSCVYWVGKFHNIEMIYCIFLCISEWKLFSKFETVITIYQHITVYISISLQLLFILK
jgi:hypothetical protein